MFTRRAAVQIAQGIAGDGVAQFVAEIAQMFMVVTVFLIVGLHGCFLIAICGSSHGLKPVATLI